MLESQVLNIGIYVILLNEKEIDTFSVHSFIQKQKNLPKYLKHLGHAVGIYQNFLSNIYKELEIPVTKL